MEIEETSMDNPQPPEPEGSRWGRAHHVLLAFLGVGVVIWLLTGFYQIQGSEVGMVERMGAMVTDLNGKVSIKTMGLHYGMPWPIDTIHKFPTGEAHSLTVKDFNTSTAATEEYKKYLSSLGYTKQVLDAVFDPYLITSDKNMLNAQLTVRYLIKDPEAYFMCVAHSESEGGTAGSSALKIMLAEREAVLSHIVCHELVRELARTRVEAALTEHRQELINRLLAGIQREITFLRLGIMVDSINLELRWPLQVDEAFTSAQRARAEMQTNIETAKSDRSVRTTRAAGGETDQILDAAKGDADHVIKQAKGEVERFNNVYEPYRAAPFITRTSLYNDTMNLILKNVQRVMYVQPGQKQTLVLDPPVVDRSQPSK